MTLNHELRNIFYMSVKAFFFFNIIFPFVKCFDLICILQYWLLVRLEFELQQNQ